MCKPAEETTVKKEQEKPLEIRVPGEREAALHETLETRTAGERETALRKTREEEETARAEAEARRFPQPAEVREAAPAPELAQQPVEQQELGWKDRQVNRWNSYQDRRHAEKAEKQRRRQAEEDRKRRRKADQWLREKADDAWEKNPQPQYSWKTESGLIRERLMRLSGLEYEAPHHLRESDVRPYLKEVRAARRLYKILLREEADLRYMEEAVIPAARGAVPGYVMERLAERKERLRGELAAALERNQKLEDRFRELLPAQEKENPPNILLFSLDYKWLVRREQEEWQETHGEWISRDRAAEVWTEKTIASRRPETLRNLEARRAEHLKEVQAREFAFLAAPKRKILRSQSDLLAARKKQRKIYESELERNRTHFVEQVLENMDGMEDRERQRAYLKDEIRSMGFMDIPEELEGLLRRLWDGADLMRRDEDNANPYRQAQYAMRTFLVNADQEYRRAHPEEYRMPEELNREIGREDWDKADLMVADYIHEAMKDASYQIRVPDCAILSAILDAGRFKSQLETNSSRGELAQDSRRQFSCMTFGVDTQALPPEKMEIYGYASHGDLVRESKGGSRVGACVSQYGQVVVKLKKERMRDRTTMLVGDSLDNFARARVAWADKPDLHAVGNRFEAVMAAWKHQFRMRCGLTDEVDMERLLEECRVGYVELQFHDTVKVEDIESVTLMADMASPDGPIADLEQAFPAGLLERLKANGIRASVVRGGEEHAL